MISSTIKEKQLQDKCIQYLKSHGIYYLNVYGSGRSGKGAPDLIVCKDGRFLAFELKVGDNDLSDAQIINRERILRSGGRFYVPRSIEDFIYIMEKLER